MNERIEILIAKYFVNQIADNELEELKEWLKQGDNKYIYKEYIDVNYMVEVSKEKMYSIEEYKKLETLLYSQKKKNARLKSIFRYAAIIIGVSVITYAIFNRNKSDVCVKISPIQNEGITLKLGDGAIKQIDGIKDEKIVNEKGNVLGFKVGREIIYNKSINDNNTARLKNTIHIPYGKSFKLTLNDGTQVHLNSGSTLTYPQFFSDNSKREVFLVGEAYFAVAKDSKRPFIVKSKNIDIAVLGTQFNVSAYPDDNKNTVVLVEGSLEIQSIDNTHNKVLLKPHQKAELDIKSGRDIEISDVSVSKYILWKEGEMYFYNEAFHDILIKLERHFNVEIINNNDKLDNIKFTARFKDESIIDILNSFKAHTSFSYKVNDSFIHIK